MRIVNADSPQSRKLVRTTTTTVFRYVSTYLTLSSVGGVRAIRIEGSSIAPGVLSNPLEMNSIKIAHLPAGVSPDLLVTSHSKKELILPSSIIRATRRRLEAWVRNRIVSRNSLRSFIIVHYVHLSMISVHHNS